MLMDYQKEPHASQILQNIPNCNFSEDLFKAAFANCSSLYMKHIWFISKSDNT